MSRAIIVDLDGTLSDDRNRVWLVEGSHRNYEMYHAGCINDLPNYNLLNYLKRQVKLGIALQFVTGRPERFRNQTWQWLRGHFDKKDINTNNLYMKSNEDMRPAIDYKEDTYKTKIKPYFHVLEAYDDVPEIVEMWKKYNINGHLIMILK